MRGWMMAMVVAGGCSSGNTIPISSPCAEFSGHPGNVECSIERDTGSTLATAEFDDGTKVVIVTEPAMTGVILNPADEGVTFTIYPVTCPSWTGSITIDDSGDSYRFELKCIQSSASATGFLRLQ